MKSKDPNELYYIQYSDYYSDCVLWWKPDRCGYTIVLEKAGLYTWEEADRISRIRGKDTPWPQSVVEQATLRVVTEDSLKAVIPPPHNA